jgi:hypothetical protein
MRKNKLRRQTLQSWFVTPLRSEGSGSMGNEILRFAQDDKIGFGR